MTWLAKLTKFERYAGVYYFDIQYTDDGGVTVFEENYSQRSVTKKGLRDLARREAAALASADTNDVDIAIGSIIDVTPDPIIPRDPPTQAEIDRDTWVADNRTLKQMNEVLTRYPALATAGRIAARDALVLSGEADWKDSYLVNI